MKFDVIVCDAPFEFSDTLTMSEVKRGADSQYEGTLTFEDIRNLKVQELSADDAVLAFWVPSSMLWEGLEIMEAWGFRQTQTHIWVKTKKVPLQKIIRSLKQFVKQWPEEWGPKALEVTCEVLSGMDLADALSFYMGRLFRQTHEICLIGVRGKNIYKKLKNKSQRSVHFSPLVVREFNGEKHSAKPEHLQDMLEIMFGPEVNYLELFARRQRKNTICLGNQAPMSFGEDIRKSLDKLIKASDEEHNFLTRLTNSDPTKLYDAWNLID